MQRAHGRVEGREELVGNQYLTARKRTHKGRLACVRIPDERDTKLIAPGVPTLRVVALDLVQLLFQLREAIANLAAIELEVGLAGAGPCCRPGPAEDSRRRGATYFNCAISTCSLASRLRA